ncbi:hypothetical protein GCM10025783_05710 [Amnibacterium soli]|uniref:Thymidylate kinase n=1 Tax=Amnibacterium soli TaxID=1282736 RepID=A0ABP8YTC3_9MICO
MESVHLRPGALIVFEGLDGAGKTTQLNCLRGRVRPESATYVHMPTGFSRFTQTVRTLLDDREVRPVSGLAQQLAHLACHAESQATLHEQRSRSAVVLDRWWWSTLAYGILSGVISDADMPRDAFERVVESTWAGMTADVVFLFGHVHGFDSNNSDAIAAGYETLAARYPALAVWVPDFTIEEVTDTILEELDHRHLLLPERS